MLRRYHYHYYGNDLTDKLVEYDDSEEAMEEIVTLVKANPRLLNALDASNRTPLFHVMNNCMIDYNQYESDKKSATGGFYCKARILLQHGANPNIQDSHGWTVLHECASNGNLPMLQLCIRNGGDVQIANKDGRKPIDLAVIKNHSPIVDYLETQSCSLRNFCRRSIRQAMGKRTYNRIDELPLPPKLKLFTNFNIPYPGFSAPVFVPRPWTEEQILNGEVKEAEIKEFFEQNASEDFNTDKQTVTISSSTSVDDLAAMMEAMYFWESFKCVKYEEQRARPPRYNMEKLPTPPVRYSQPNYERAALKCRQQ